MNHTSDLRVIDPIFNEYETFIDKDAGLKTIAFKYFSADISEAIQYLQLSSSSNQEAKNFSIIKIISKDIYYQPELI